ncbi:MAG: hypothetical protein ACYCQL_02305 [Acidithiobacillus sp.]
MEHQRATSSEASAQSRPSLQQMMDDRRVRRETIARHRAACVLWALRKKGVRGRVVGSLAQGRAGASTFRLHSDVDFLITKCPRALKYTVENDVEDLMEGMPFDVIYLEETRDAWKRSAKFSPRKIAESLGIDAGDG